MTQEAEPRDGEKKQDQSVPDQAQSAAANTGSTAPTARAKTEPQNHSQLAEREVVGVRLDTQQESYDYDTTGLILSPGDLVLVETERDPKPGTVVRAARKIKINPAELRRVIRRTAKGQGRVEQKISPEQEQEAFQYGLSKIREFNLPMKLVRAEYNRNGSQISFYFSSEDRVDFRALVRDLARHFRARIEMRQIGVRDQAKKVGGIGLCGRELCCSSWIHRFAPVSIRMAKVQGLALNPQKVSGVCGRLLCCLNYEQQVYKELRKGLPKLGKRTETPLGEGRVREVNVLRGRVKVQLPGGIKEFDRSELCKDCPKAQDPAALRDTDFATEIDPVVSRPSDSRSLQQRSSTPRRPGADTNTKRSARPKSSRSENESNTTSTRNKQGIKPRPATNSEPNNAGETEAKSDANRQGQRRSSRGRSRGRSGSKNQAQGTEGNNRPANTEQKAGGAKLDQPATPSKKRRRRRRRKPRSGGTPPAQANTPQGPQPQQTPASSGPKNNKDS